MRKSKLRPCHKSSTVNTLLEYVLNKVSLINQLTVVKIKMERSEVKEP